MATVKVSQGSLKGGKSKTENGFMYYEFLGIPYAKPPVGDLRFKSPQPPESWKIERDAIKVDRINISCQVDLFTGEVAGSEDCLYLNVYTPKLDSKALLPVIVYIHGGGFIFGNGIIKSENGPDFLVENNTVVVTFNYRLGVFGFLSLDIPEATGNMGLKDQVKALEWVQNNINEFGGDSNNVTIMGLSAGSVSVEYLILSPLAKGLFHKAILQSGSTLNPWGTNFNIEDLVERLLKSLDYKGSSKDSQAIHKFLLTIPASGLTEIAFQETANYPTQNVFFGFVPTIEKDFGNSDAFLTANPYKLLKEGTFNQVPTIRGFCNKEGSLMGLLKPNELRSAIDSKKFANFLPYAIESNEIGAYNTKYEIAYLNNTQDAVEDVIDDFFGDLDFVAGIWIAGKLSAQKVPVYSYQFSHDGKSGLKKLFGIMKKGAVHGEDGSYVIKQELLKSEDENDIRTCQRIVKMFTSFAKTGEPVSTTDDLIPINWPAYTEDSQVFLNIDKDLSLKRNYEPNKIAIFESLYEKYYGAGFLLSSSLLAKLNSP